MAFDISIVTGSDVPIYRQIVDQVCRAIATGGLTPGDQLPSVRGLAEQLVINPNTVRKTYADLVREGVLESRQGKGVFVARRRAIYTKAERARRLDAALEAFVNEGVYLGFAPDELHEALSRKLRQFTDTIDK
jgi:GntR family transcriptional regulator